MRKTKGQVMKLSNLERETVITFNEAENFAEVITYNSRMKRTLAGLAADRPEDVQHVKTNPEGGATYRTPKSWVKIRASRILSEAQKAASMKAMAKAHLSRANNRRRDA